MPLFARRTSIVVAHRLSTVLAADTILVLDHSRIVERGRHSDLVAGGGIYTRLYEGQLAPRLRCRPEGREPISIPRRAFLRVLTIW